MKTRYIVCLVFIVAVAASGILISCSKSPAAAPPADPTVPSLVAPANNISNQPTSVTLSWASMNSAISYGVQVSTDKNFSSTVFEQTGYTSGDTVTVDGLANATTYYWQVNAVSSSGTGKWANAWSFTTVIAAPDLASPSNGAVNQAIALTLNWGSVEKATSYSAQVSTVATFATTVLNQTGLAATSAVISGLAYGMTYYWQVNATDGAGVGGWSPIWRFATLSVSATPVFPVPANGATGQWPTVTFSWTCNPQIPGDTLRYDLS